DARREPDPVTPSLFAIGSVQDRRTSQPSRRTQGLKCEDPQSRFARTCPDAPSTWINGYREPTQVRLLDQLPGFPLPGWEFYLKHHLREPIHCPTSGSIMSRTSHSRSSSIRGFSMVEMIGVLAIIAILAVVIVPKVFSTIASSRITIAVGSINGVKTAVAEFTGKYGTLPTTSGNSRIDDLLVTAGLLEQRFSVKIGTQPAGTPPAAAEWTRTNGLWSASRGSSQSSQPRLINVTSNTNNPS